MEELFPAATTEKEAKQEDPPGHTSPGQEEVGSSLLGYDTQWCWVESQDDVTFL